MAIEAHVDKLKEGVEAWNAWRGDNPDVVPDLSGFNLVGMDISGADFRQANLRGAQLGSVTGLLPARLAGADLTHAELPAELSDFPALAHVAEVSRHARVNFLAVVASCVFCWLTIAQTADGAEFTRATGLAAANFANACGRIVGLPSDISVKPCGPSGTQVASAGETNSPPVGPETPDKPPEDPQVAVGISGEDVGKIIRDCSECPEMVVVPAGEFVMGSPESEADRSADEGPQHGVKIAAAFAVGRFEVTRDQFDAFVRATGFTVGSSCWTFENDKWDHRTGRSYRDPGFSQSGNHPAVCVNWDDAKAYVTWLVNKTKQPYRLLSEAEWEYVARAGSTSRFSFGDRDDELCGHGNGADRSTDFSWRNDSCDDGYGNTAPVGSFAANAFNVHDMHGNVWEWMEDCWNDSYTGAPDDGTAWEDGDCDHRVLRGGSWSSRPRHLQSASRSEGTPDGRLVIFGFRVARTLTP